MICCHSVFPFVAVATAVSVQLSLMGDHACRSILNVTVMWLKWPANSNLIYTGTSIQMRVICCPTQHHKHNPFG